eukprot:TRINITY_DN10628_c0_g1_i2.p1 TRINITY_DN10628_c0_g1~~TRINITY_DN10628_c0_g1_i2.p1  ORF type:complete len:396 (-),score=91.68 TRINITY_DN10628_c0_g1_i2:300-1388(-)
MCEDMRRGRTPARVVILIPMAQMANRVRALVSTLIFGMLTNRTTQTRFTTAFFADMQDIFDPITPLENPDFLNIASNKVIDLAQSSEALLCDNFLGPKYAPLASLFLSGVTYVVPLLYLNPHLQPRFRELFGSPDGLFQATMAFFLTPAPEVREKLRVFRQQNQLHNSFVVGLHIRSGQDFRDPMPQTDWLRYRDCAYGMIPATNTKPVRFFVATDTARSRDIASNIFLNTSLGARTFNPPASVIFHDKFLISNNALGVQHALVDLLMVTQSDAQVLSCASSYSEFARSMARAPERSVFVEGSHRTSPRFVYDSKEEVAPHCLRPRSREPSFEDLRSVFSANAKCMNLNQTQIASSLTQLVF